MKRIIGGTITGVDVSGQMDADAEYTFNPKSEYGMEVELEAIWEPATVLTGNSSFFDTNNKGSVERNFYVYTSSNSNSNNDITAYSYPCTYTSIYPNGTTDGTNAATSVTVTRRGGFTASADSKIEYINLNDNSSTITANGYNLTIGRGVKNSTSGSLCANLITGTGSNYNDKITLTDPNYHIKIESGTYNYLSIFGGYYTTTESTANPGQGTQESGVGYTIVNVTDISKTNVRVTMGCDFDRACADNNNLTLSNCMTLGYRNEFSASNRTNPHTLDLYIKSGKIGSNFFMDNSSVTDAGHLQGGAGYGHYISSGAVQTNVGGRNVYMEGGESCTIGSGIDKLNNAETGSTNENTTTNLGREGFHFRMSGGKIHGNVYGGASKSPSGGNRQMIFTGGQIMGWCAAGCNGTADRDGQNYGTSWVYFGGDASLNSNADNEKYTTGITKTLGYAQGGNLYAAGAGKKDASSSGEMTFGTNLVVADNSYVQRGIYGGGNYGYALDHTNIYITGGTNAAFSDTSNSTTTAGGVYGGANNQKGEVINIYMTGGDMRGGIYGGSNTQGTISGDVTLKVLGGTVGSTSANAHVCGGGYGSTTRVAGNVTVTIGNATTHSGPTIYGDVYGGSEQGWVNTALSATATYDEDKTTSVTLNGGHIIGTRMGAVSTEVGANAGGGVFGGGLGTISGVNGATASNLANVYGKVAVKVTGGQVDDGVYGCNNQNGEPKGEVTVTVDGTDNVTNAVKGVFGGGFSANYSNTDAPKVVVNGGNIRFVFGGGNAAAVKNTDVKVTGGTIENVFGGGNGSLSDADVNGTVGTKVVISGGTMKNVYGGCNKAGVVAANTDVQVAGGQVYVEEGSGKVGAVYGGGALADVTGNTQVKLTGGAVNDVYGGAMGQKESSDGAGDGIAAKVGGTAKVELNPIVSGTTNGNCVVYGLIFGCNNANGSPKGHATVHVYATAARAEGTVASADEHTDKAGKLYHVRAVYGGGNEAAYEPTSQGLTKATSDYSEVIIDGCSQSSICDVYGGGNSAPCPATQVTVNGGKIYRIFGGGNGSVEGKPGAHIGYLSFLQKPASRTTDPILDATTYGSGRAETYVYGGEIGSVFGGSNTYGHIRTEAYVNIDESGDCPLTFDEGYASGNEAPMYCKGTLDLGCISYMKALYGGAKNADVGTEDNPVDIKLNITSGKIDQVFGGNNLGGTINGFITVNIDETGCHPIIIGEVYAGGNEARYTTPDMTAANASIWHHPIINVYSCSKIGSVFGGGYGANAVLEGNPTVNIQQIPGKYDPDKATATPLVKADNDEALLGAIGNVYGGGNKAVVDGSTTVNIATTEEVKHLNASATDLLIKTGANIIDSVYGGGNQADVKGHTQVNVGVTP